MEALNTGSQNLNAYTAIIDEFIASYHNHFPQPDSLYGVKEQSPEHDLTFLSAQVNSFIAGYHDFLKALWNSTLSGKIKELAGNNDESLLFGGDKLFLPDNYREEMISAWLLWILRGDILEDDMRKKVLNNIFSGMLQEDQFNKWVNLSFNNANFEREYQLGEYRIDILIETSDSIIVIENKIGDKHFDKNIAYRNELNKKFAGKTLHCFLIVPGKDLEEYLEEESEEEYKEKEETNEASVPEQTDKLKVLSSFPPVTWEEFLTILRTAIKENDNDNIRWKHWKTLALAFISCVEGNVLGFNLMEIKESVNASQPPLHLIQQINKYLKYLNS